MSEPQISVLSTLSDDGNLIEDQSKGNLIKQEIIAEGHVTYFLKMFDFFFIV